MRTHRLPLSANQYLTKIDIFIILIIAISALLSLPIAMSASSVSGSSILTVYKAGQKVASYNLSQPRTVKVKGINNGYCLLKIKDGKAYIIKSNCPLKICQKQGQISKGGQTIICAPSGLLFQIESQQESSLDAINE